MKDVTVQIGPGLKDDAELQSAVARASNWLVDGMVATARPVVAFWDRNTLGGGGGLVTLRLTDSLGSAVGFFAPHDLTSLDPMQHTSTRLDLRGVYRQLLQEGGRVLIRKLLEPDTSAPEEEPALAAQNAH